jgi:hypothetical protein
MTAFAQLQTDVRDLIGDPSSQSNTWTDDQVKDAINAAVLNYCEKTGVTYVETELTSDAGGLVTLPGPAIDVHRVLIRQGA